MATVHPHRSFAKIASALTGMRHLNITANYPKYKRGEEKRRPPQSQKSGSPFEMMNGIATTHRSAVSDRF